MSGTHSNTIQNSEAVNFDLVRLGKSKEVVDLSPNTIRAYSRAGLRIFKSGKMVFFSRSELEVFIKARATIIIGNGRAAA
jgi:hypothetical protein